MPAARTQSGRKGRLRARNTPLRVHGVACRLPRVYAIRIHIKTARGRPRKGPMLTALIPFVLLTVGALVYALSNNAKVCEMGRIAFFCGLFWLAYGLAGHTLRLG